MIIDQLMIGWPASLQIAVSGYVEEHALPVNALVRADLALILLRINSEEALAALPGLTGCAITKCPSAMPPWPPKPVQRAPRLVFTRVEPYSGHVGTEMAQRYSLLKPGMTKEEALSKGITSRDLRYWQDKGRVELAQR